MLRYVFIGFALGAVGFWFFAGGSRTAEVADGPAGAALAAVIVPGSLSDTARAGRDLFDAQCAACHGTNAAGQEDVAPPLVHKIYEPSHHGDESFQLAVARGVLSHHWSFGNMPAVEGLSRADVDLIVAYVREMQRANGIN